MVTARLIDGIGTEMLNVIVLFLVSVFSRIGCSSIDTPTI